MLRSNLSSPVTLFLKCVCYFCLKGYPPANRGIHHS